MRDLSLRIERLSELTTDELASVAGGEARTLQLDCTVVVRTLRGCTTAIICPVPDA